jgi:allantoicase
MPFSEESINPFGDLIDLASERLGGKALAASDEFFASKENLLKPAPPLFIPHKYTDRGKWMDGWETRRKRTPGHDWCIIKLGCAGIIRGIDVDTSYFLGNNPAYASLDACVGAPSLKNMTWQEIMPRVPLKPGSHNFFAVADERRWTHVRLNIYPDGGVARLRVYGMVVPEWAGSKQNRLVDLAAVENGGIAVAASDMFFSPINNLIMPGRARSMADGWETRRRRGPGHDWVIIKLGHPGFIHRVEVDTNYFKGNYPDRCSIDVCYETTESVDILTTNDVSWVEILPSSPLQAHKRHYFERQLRKMIRATHLRLNIYPDGGISRLRAWGTITNET